MMKRSISSMVLASLGKGNQDPKKLTKSDTFIRDGLAMNNMSRMLAMYSEYVDVLASLDSLQIL
jgi:hypothetical protein